jgi:hypothetical protein
MACGEKADLLTRYHAAKRVFCAAAKGLHDSHVTCPQEERERLHGALQETLIRVEQASLTLEQHVALHDC